LKKGLSEEKGRVAILSEDLKRENTRHKKDKEEREHQAQLIQYLQQQIGNEATLRREMVQLESKYKACKFYELLMKKSNNDEEEIAKYLTSNGDINLLKFKNLLKKNLDHNNKANTEHKRQIIDLTNKNMSLVRDLDTAKCKFTSLKGKESGMHDVQNYSFGFSYASPGINTQMNSPRTKKRHEELSPFSFDKDENKAEVEDDIGILLEPFDFNAPSTSKVPEKREDSFVLLVREADRCSKPKNRNSTEVVCLQSDLDSPHIPRSLYDHSNLIKQKADCMKIKRKLPINKSAESNANNLKALSKSNDKEPWKF